MLKKSELQVIKQPQTTVSKPPYKIRGDDGCTSADIVLLLRQSGGLPASEKLSVKRGLVIELTGECSLVDSNRRIVIQY